MEITTRKGRLYTVTPIPENPEFVVTVKELSVAETNAIWDKHGLIPNSPKATMAKIQRVIHDTIKAAVVSWEGLTEEGAEIKCTDQTKPLLAESEVEGADGEITTLWSVIQESIKEQKQANAKN